MLPQEFTDGSTALACIRDDPAGLPVEFSCSFADPHHNYEASKLHALVHAIVMLHQSVVQGEQRFG